MRIISLSYFAAIPPERAMGSELKLLPISAVIISKDAEATIGLTLQSLRRFAEVIVYDNGSQDRTIEIARGYSNVRVHQGEFFGFGPTKNHAAGLAAHDWVFSIDSDERVEPELLGSIANVELSRPNIGYRVKRVNYLRGKRVRFSGWSNDWLLRLYNRKCAQLSDAIVHEVVQPSADGPVIDLDGELSHEPVRELSELLVKIDRYSELRRVRPKRHISPPLICLRSLWSFIRTYFIQLGFLDGWRGLTIAVCNANGVFFKYMKPYVDRVEPENRQASAAVNLEQDA
jgi:glycosyltransferase involved in cell wall biosynthesis